MPDSVNQTLTTAQNIFKDLVWDSAVTAIKIEAPWMNIPVIGWIVDLGFSVMWRFFVLFVDVTSIKLLNSVHQSAYEKASIKLALYEKDYGLDSKEYKDAKESAKIAMSNFTRINGH